VGFWIATSTIENRLRDLTPHGFKLVAQAHVPSSQLDQIAHAFLPRRVDVAICNISPSSISSTRRSLLVRRRHHDQIALTLSIVEGERLTGVTVQNEWRGLTEYRGASMSAQLYTNVRNPPQPCEAPIDWQSCVV
jgi:hypothetical protein